MARTTGKDEGGGDARSDASGAGGDGHGAAGGRAPQADYLGYGVYADTLWARMARALAKDADGRTPLGDDPLVVGIFGEWGAGKSKLLSLVQDRARAQSRRDIAERILTATSGNPLTVTVPVFFQPWKYEHERHLHVPLAVHIAQALEEAWKVLPADIEQLRGFVAATGKTAAEVGQTLEAARGEFSKLKRLWGVAQEAVQSRAGAVVAGTADILLTSVGVPPFASLAREKIVGAMGGQAARGQGGDDEVGGDGGGEGPDAEDAEARSGGKPAKADQPASARARQPNPKPAPADPWAWKDDGLGFYRMQRQLQALTRPKLDAKLLKAAGLDPTPGIEFDLRINFVVFIDDLDRCLPEKAVEALELIKTVFNLESFAFVLALDEEVVERGIGHRYRDYHFEGKKPEMPITGFEYLEKIVHLPFRLPALTRAQAADFVHRYEASVEPDAQRRWFSLPNAQLLVLALDGFDVYVPRKLVRLVELMHQIAAVAQARGRPLGLMPTTGASVTEARVDVRVVLALAQLQLFQPELFRLMRRRQGAFPELLAAFANATQGKPNSLASAELADMDLWRWVACESDLPHSTQVTYPQREAAPEDRRQGGLGWLPTQSVDPVIARIQAIQERAVRNVAQQLRLPMVRQLVEYREAQRHGFNALALMQALAHSMDATDSQPQALNFSPYVSLLGDQPGAPLTAPPPASAASLLQGIGMAGEAGAAKTPDSAASSGKPGAVQDSRPRHTPRDLQKLFDAWSASLSSVQANLAGDNELPDGAVLDSESAQALLAQARKWLQAQPDKPAALQRLTTGLQQLAPYIGREDGPAFWELVRPQDQGADELGKSLADLAALAQRDTRADLRSALGADPRFDPGFFYLPRERFKGHDATVEPIPGFVRVTTEASPEWPHPFYMARHLTTVDQYAAFVDGQGYDNPAWWDDQGWRWRTGALDVQVKNDDLRKRLADRDVSLRREPMGWVQQRAHGSRPVCQINWFEARTYARWLTAQPSMRERLAQAQLRRYRMQLPTEAQWQRAAQAKDLAAADDRDFPWGGKDEVDAHLQANLGLSVLGRVCVVGLFPSNPLGLLDLAGNLWEWQDNLNQGAKGSQDLRVTRDQPLRMGEGAERPAVRGGSWVNRPELARCSWRDWHHPDRWGSVLGFRVVLSLAESEP